MTRYIVSVIFPFIPENLKKQVIKAEFEKVMELKKQNIVLDLMVSKEQNSAWMIINSNKDEINNVIESLPIFPYLYINKIVELLENIEGSVKQM